MRTLTEQQIKCARLINLYTHAVVELDPDQPGGPDLYPSVRNLMSYLIDNGLLLGKSGQKLSDIDRSQIVSILTALTELVTADDLQIREQALFFLTKKPDVLSEAFLTFFIEQVTKLYSQEITQLFVWFTFLFLDSEEQGMPPSSNILESDNTVLATTAEVV